MHADMNSWLLAAGVALECALLAALWVRHVAGRMPLFTVLIAFYVLRAGLLFLIFGHIARAGYASLYAGLSLLDLLLQTLVAAELALALYRVSESDGGRGEDRWTRRAALRLLAAMAAASALFLLAVTLLPAFVPIPVDRMQLFLWCVFPALWASAPRQSAPALAQRVALGFGLFGGASLLIEAAQIHAAIERNAASYRAWSYGHSALYALVVIFWLFSLRRPGANEPTILPAGQTGATAAAG